MIGDRWNVSDEEISRAYPCDEFVDPPTIQAWRGVTVDARPEDVWPWVTQIRLAPYSYDWIDNLGRRSPQEVRGLPEPVVGEPFTTAANHRWGRVLSVDPHRQLTGTLVGVVISYVIVPTEANTRLLMKLVGPARGWLLPMAPGLVLGDLVMARRQLLNFKRLAERARSRS